MEVHNRNIVEREPDGHARHALTPAMLLKDSGKAVGAGALTGAIAGALAGAVAGAAAWSIYVLGREAVKAFRERTHL
jgi:phage tail tape-measure protein